MEVSQPPSTGPGVDAQRRPHLHTQGLALPWGQRGCQGDRLPRARHPSRQWRLGVGRSAGRVQLRACTCDHAATIWGWKRPRDGSCLLGTTENIVSMSAGYARLTSIHSGLGTGSAAEDTDGFVVSPAHRLHSCPCVRPVAPDSSVGGIAHWVGSSAWPFFPKGL